MMKKLGKEQRALKRNKTCPICKTVLKDDAESKKWQPFCSKRCKMIDLGEWLSDSYRIATAETGSDTDESKTP
jgi:endogenous inhibitor of DNA gyrase (YacG/DUF329 family)